MKRDERNSLIVWCSLVVIIITLAGLWWVAMSAAEARAYNRITGANVSTLDAMFIELRVQDAPQR